MIKNRILFLIGILFLTNIGAQSQSKVKFICFSNGSDCFPKSINISQIIDSNLIQKTSKTILTELHNLSYLEAVIDSIKTIKNEAFAYYTIGNQYSWKSIEINNDDIISSILFKNSYDFNKKNKYNYSDILAVQDKILTTLENNGYPFATVYLDSINILKKEIDAQLYVEQGPLVLFDSIILPPNIYLRKKLLESMIGLKKGAYYDERIIKQIDPCLHTIPYVKSSQSSQLKITNNLATITIFALPQKINQIDALAGFQSDPNTSGKMILTGYLKLDLYNSLKNGEHIKFKWENSGNQSQLLNAFIYYPYIFGLKISASFEFELEKVDTQYLNTQMEPSIIYNISPFAEIGLYGNFFNTSSTLDNNPKIVSGKINSGGILIKINHLNYNYNPRSGYSIQFKADLGSKIYTTSESSLANNPITSGKISTDLAWYIPILKRSTILIANKLGLNESEVIYENELYKIGGSQLLRGFNERSILNLAYLVQTFEYRWLIEQNSYLGLFYDFGDVISPYKNQSGLYHGFGATMSFITEVGIFKLSYAIGKLPNQQLLLNNSKIHFGYTALF